MRHAPSISKRLAILLLATAVGLTTFLARPASSEAAAAAKWPKNFTMVYCWGTSDVDDIGPWCPCADLTLYKDRSVDVFDCATGNFYPNSGNWSKTRRWREITFSFNGLVVYTGTKQPDGTYLGTMVTPSGLMGVWQGEFLP